MRAALWLAWRDVVERKRSFAATVALVAVAAALCTAVELVSMARETAVGGQIDQIGPAVRLIPAGRTAIDHARFDLGPRHITRDDVASLRRELSPWARVLEGRLLLRLPVEGGPRPVAGVDPSATVSPLAALHGLGATDAAAGTSLAAELGKRAGERVVVKGEPFRLAAVLPETASQEDLALFLPLRSLQRLAGLPDVVNEVRVFPLLGAPVDEMVSHLRRTHPELHVLRADRGTTVDRELSQSLGEHRGVVYLATGLVVALIVFISSLLHAGEKRVETATLVAVGCPSSTVLASQTLRAAAAGLLGGFVGWAVGASLALVQDYDSAAVIVWSASPLLVMPLGGVGVSVLGAVPVAIHATARDHVTVLQEGA